MTEAPGVVAVVPARGGSKGIPRKNVADLAGKPLLAYTLEAARGARGVSETVVSSDDPGILALARSQGATALVRPAALAGDGSPCEPAIADALGQLARLGRAYPVLVLLQPTSPLRDAGDVDAALRRFLESGATSLISVYEPVHSPCKAFRLDERGMLRGLLDDAAPFRNRQELPTCFQPNGAIYVTRVDRFLATGTLFSERTVPFVMPRERSADIDGPEDLAAAAAYLARAGGAARRTG
jgi:CMP-N,N'-diacetyllegionaminic acid synthase